MSAINFSVIIPHKNIPHLLQRCLDSIPIREDVEVIVVDDHSDPKIVDFSNFPKWLGNNYVTIFATDKSRGGVGYTRNQALDIVKGKWMTLLDADDVFTTEVGLLMDKYINASEDVIMFNLERRDVYTMELLRDDAHWYNQRIKMNNINPIDLMMDLSIAGAKFFRTSNIEKNHIRHDEIKYHSDTMFVTRNLVYSNKVKVCPNEYLYVWTFRPDSLSNTINKKHIVDHVNSEVQRFKFVKKERKDIHLGNYQIELLIEMKQLRLIEQIPLIAKLLISGLMFNISIYEPIKSSRILWQICSTLKKGIKNQFSQS